jgi:hypothetical protein
VRELFLSSFTDLKFELDVDARSKTTAPIIKQAKEMDVVEDVRVEPAAADSKGKKDKHDSSRTRSGSRPRSGREKEDQTSPKKVMFGQSTTTGGDSIGAKASNKSKGAVRRFSTSSFSDGPIKSSDDVSRSQPASSRKLKFVSRRNSITNDIPGNDVDSCENATTGLASTRSRRSSTSKTAV